MGPVGQVLILLKLANGKALEQPLKLQAFNPFSIADPLQGDLQGPLFGKDASSGMRPNQIRLYAGHLNTPGATVEHLLALEV